MSKRSTLHCRVRPAIAAALALALVLPGAGAAAERALEASAPTLGPTLARIAATRTINLGHRESSVPFSYYDARHRVVGYAQDLANAVAADVRTHLKLPALTVKLVPVTSQNRIALVHNGSVDLECGSTSNTAARARLVAFSTNFFVVTTRLLVPRGSGVVSLADLRGRSVVVTAGTTTERLLHRYNEAQGGGVKVRAERDHLDSFRRLEAGDAAAFLLDDALLYGMRARSKDPSAWEVVGPALSREAYACMMRLDDPGFKAVVDGAIRRHIASGAALASYQRWFQSPIPPSGLNLAWPPSDELLTLFRNPDDRPMD